MAVLITYEKENFTYRIKSIGTDNVQDLQPAQLVNWLFANVHLIGLVRETTL